MRSHTLLLLRAGEDHHGGGSGQAPHGCSDCGGRCVHLGPPCGHSQASAACRWGTPAHSFSYIPCAIIQYTFEGYSSIDLKLAPLTGARDVARAANASGASAGGWEVVFHRGQSQVARPHAVAVCAGELPGLPRV